MDNIDVAAAEELGIPVVTSAGASTRAVVELTIGLLLQGARRLARADEAVRAGRFTQVCLSSVRDARPIHVAASNCHVCLPCLC